MAIPDYQTLMLPVLRHAADGEVRVPEVAKKIAENLGLTPDERDKLLPSGRQSVLHNRIHWAKFYMTKAGLIISPRRGWFIVSDEGRTLLARSPARIDSNLLLDYPSFQEFYRRDGDAAVAPDASGTALPLPSPISVTTPEEQIDAAYVALQAALRVDVLQRILQNSPTFFEQAIVDLLVRMGYGGSRESAAAELTPRTGDGGIDGVINEDRLGLDRVYIQAKRYALGNSVGRPDVQAFVGSLVGRNATKGVFVTTSSFSSQAVEFVRHLTQRVILIDGERLADLMIEHNVGVRVDRSVEFKRLDEDFFSEEE